MGKYVRSVHCKDGNGPPRTKRGKEWGTEVALGTGDVGMENYLRTLKEIGYMGPLTIEREIAHDREKQKADISIALKLLTELRKKILA